jgi:hypothetical protein
MSRILKACNGGCFRAEAFRGQACVIGWLDGCRWIVVASNMYVDQHLTFESKKCDLQVKSQLPVLERLFPDKRTRN